MVPFLKKALPGSLACLVSISFSLGKQDELAEIVVVETRSPKPEAEVSPWVTTLKESEWTFRQVEGVSGLLRSVAGLSLVRSGQVGSQVSLFSRGGNSDHTTFLYEGRKLNGGFSGTYDLGQLTLAGLSSVEVLCGSSSTLYGAEGIGGAIMLRSNLSQRPGSLSFEGGSNGYLLGRLERSFDGDGWSASTAFSVQGTDNEQPHSSFDNRAASIVARRELADGVELDMVGVFGWTHLNYPGNAKSIAYPVEGQFQELEETLVSPGLEFDLGSWRAKGHYCFSQDRIEAKDSWAHQDFLTRSHGLDFQAEYLEADDWGLLWGGSWEEESFRKVALPTGVPEVDDSLVTKSAFVQLRFLGWEESEWALGARTDDFSDFGGARTWSLSGSRKLIDSLAFFARYATSFAPPQANDLYGMWGNPLLNPEEAYSWEFGLKGTSEEWSWRLGAYRTDFRDLISWSGFTTANIGRARADGIEFSAERDFADFMVRAGYAYGEAWDEDDSTRLPRRPRHSGTLAVEKRNDEFGFGVELSWVADREDVDGAFPYGAIEGEDYFVTRFYGQTHLGERTILYGRVENLFDEEYAEADGYPALGLGVYGGVRYSF
jgi:vitamin B12 transporter